MAKNVEHKANVNQEAVLSGFPGIEFVKEYLDLEKPEIKEWKSAPKDNLIVCLQFSECLPFPEFCFQEFIVQMQSFAFAVKADVVEILDELEEALNSDTEVELSDEEKYNLEMPKYMNENWVPDTNPELRKSKLKRFIWNSGIYFQKYDEDEEAFQIEIEKKPTLQQLIISCNWKSISAKNELEALISWFKSRIEKTDVLAICTCDLCKIKDIQSAYSVKYKYLENLREKYEPKVQCYGSGLMKRLDDISIVKKPEFSSVIINAPADDDFCKKAKQHLFPPTGSLFTDPFDRNKLLGGTTDEDYRRKVENADVIVILVSSDLIGGDDKFQVLARKMAHLAIENLKKKTSLVLAVIVREYHRWSNDPPFDHNDIQVLSDEPIADPNNDLAWSKISSGLQPKIKNWLKNKSDFKSSNESN